MRISCYKARKGSMEEILDPVADHISKLRAAGDEAYRQGKVERFLDFGEKQKYRANVSAIGVVERSPILWELHNLVDQDKLALVAAKDFPLYFTLLEAQSDESAWRTLAPLWRAVDHQFMTNADSRRLTIGTELAFSEVVAEATGNVSVFSNMIDESVQNLRRELDHFFEEFGLATGEREFVLKIRLARIVHSEATSDPGRLREFRQKLEPLIATTRARPVHFKVTKFFRGSLFDLLTSKIAG